MSQKPGDRIVYRQKRKPQQGSPKATGRARVLQYDSERTWQSVMIRYGATVVALLLATVILWPIREAVGLLNTGLIYLVLIAVATVFAGQRAGLLASLLGFLLFDYFLVPPYLTFVISDAQHILALFVFLGVSILISWLLADARKQAENAQHRADDVHRLYELSQAIIGAQRVDEVLPAIAQKVYEVFQAQACWILLPNAQQQLLVRAQAPAGGRLPSREELSLALWSFMHGHDTGKSSRGSGPSQGGISGLMKGRDSNRSAFVPLRAAGRTLGVLAVADKKDNALFTPAERTVLATFADQAAVALERLTLLREAERAELLARTDELKSALMSAVSHDLRTPLASIMASVTSLLEPKMEWDEETEREFLQGIYDEARRLNRLVGNLLDMSRIEGGALHPEKDWYAISEVIEAVVQRLEPLLADHPLTMRLADDIPLLRFDYTEIDQVLSNLIENAIKYSPKGAAIQVGARRMEDRVEVSVEDSGPGVTPEQLQRLFEKFYRADNRNRSLGTGLGLAITKGFVEAHGGQIWAQNELEGGLKVVFTLPISTPPGDSRVTELMAVGKKADG